MPTLNTAGALRRRLRSLFKKRAALHRDVRVLTAEDDQAREAERRAEDTRRKLLTGDGVLWRVLERRGLIRWLRQVLDAGLTRSYDRSLFGLADDGPLIPEQDWPGWPDARHVEGPLAEAPPNRLSSGRRRARLAYLTKRLAAIDTQLDDLAKEYAPHRDETNDQRKILVGAVFLKLSARNGRVTRWLRRLLDRRYSVVKDRMLFRLEDGGPLVPAEDQAGLQPNRPQAAKTRASDHRSASAAGTARRPRSASTGTHDSGGAGASRRSEAVRAREPERAGDDAVAPVQDPIPGWQPHRLRGASPCRSGGRTRASDWGARLIGHAAVGALPEELRGRAITVTDSNRNAWTTTITEVVSRDEGHIIVRNSGRPRSDRACSRGSKAPAPSST